MINLVPVKIAYISLIGIVLFYGWSFGLEFISKAVAFSLILHFILVVIISLKAINLSIMDCIISIKPAMILSLVILVTNLLFKENFNFISYDSLSFLLIVLFLNVFILLTIFKVYPSLITNIIDLKLLKNLQK